MSACVVSASLSLWKTEETGRRWLGWQRVDERSDGGGGGNEDSCCCIRGHLQEEEEGGRERREASREGVRMLD